MIENETALPDLIADLRSREVCIGWRVEFKVVNSSQFAGRSCDTFRSLGDTCQNGHDMEARLSLVVLYRSEASA